MRNFALLCAALAVVSAIVSANLWRELRTERQLTSQLKAQVAGGDPAIPEAPRPALPAMPVAQEASQKTENPAPAAPPAATPEPNARTSTARVSFNQAELMKDPDYRKAMQAQLRMSLPQNYPDLAEELGLTPEEAGKLFDLLAEYQLEMTSSEFSLSGRQLDQAAIEEMTRRSQDIQRRQNEAVSSMLGSVRFEQWKGYQQTQGARVQVAQWGRTLQSAGMPLTETQMRPLTTAYIAEQRRQREEAQAMARNYGQMSPQEQLQMQETSMERQAESNRRMLDVARSHLTAQQLEALQTSMEQQLAMSRAFMRAQRQQIEAQGQGGQAGTTQVITTVTAP